MKEFTLQNLELEERSEIFEDREETILHLKKEELFDNIEEQIRERGNNIEITPPNIPEEDIVRLAFQSLNSTGSRLLLIWLRTYFEHGNISFSRNANNQFQAHITFR